MLILTIVYMERDVMILMGANPFRGHLEGVSPKKSRWGGPDGGGGRGVDQDKVSPGPPPFHPYRPFYRTILKTTAICNVHKIGLRNIKICMWAETGEWARGEILNLLPDNRVTVYFTDFKHEYKTDIR
jgi:hypothetical protein